MTDIHKTINLEFSPGPFLNYSTKTLQSPCRNYLDNEKLDLH